MGLENNILEGLAMVTEAWEAAGLKAGAQNGVERVRGWVALVPKPI